MDALEALKARRSVRRFLPQPVAREALEALVDAARHAPTARNEQPWDFVAVTARANIRAVAELTDHGRFMADAGACIAVFCADTKYFVEDGCAATENILIAAAALGLGTCWIAGDKKPYAEDIRRLLKIPEGHKLVSLVAVGHPDGPPATHPKRDLSRVLHWECFSA